jgi:hypothetical protein
MVHLIGKKLFDHEKKQLYKAILELWHVGEVTPKELYFKYLKLNVECYNKNKKMITQYVFMNTNWVKAW